MTAPFESGPSPGDAKPRFHSLTWSTDRGLHLQTLEGSLPPQAQANLGQPLDSAFCEFPAELVEVHRNVLDEGTSHGGHYSWWGSTWLVHVHPRRESQANVVGCSAIAMETCRGTRELELRQQFERSLDMLCVAAADGYFKRINAAFAATLGYSEADLLSRPLIDCVHPDDRQSTLDALHQLATGSPAVRFVHRYRCADGQYKTLEWNCIPAPEPGLHFATARDVTSQQRKHDELARKLRDSTERVRLGLEGSGVGIWDWNMDRNELLMIQDWSEILDDPPVENQDRRQPWEEHVHPDDRSTAQSALRRHLQGDSPYYQCELRRRTKSGSWRWLLERGKVITWAAHGKPLRSVGMHLDVTQQKKAERALRETEARFRQMFEYAALGMAMADVGPEVILLETNRALENMLGYDEGELVERSLFEITHPDDQRASRQEFLQLIDGTQARFTLESRYVRKDRTFVWSRLSVSMVRAEDGSPNYMIGVMEDITDQTLAQQHIQAEQRLLRRLLDLQDRERRLLAYEIHDGLVQDVIGAKLYVDWIHDRLGDANTEFIEPVEGLKRVLGRSIDEGRRLISDLRPMIIDEMGIVEALNYLVGEEAGTVFEITFEHQVRFERLPALLEGTVYRIVQEAVNNARRHSGSQQVRIGLSEKDDRMHLTIVDDGVGFDPAAVPKSRFGLEGIRERTRLFGGQARIESEPGKGTRIVVIMPLCLPLDLDENHRPA